MNGKRSACMERKTAETDIRLGLCLDGTGTYAIETGIGFLDHMLCLFAKHGLFDLNIRCEGDLAVGGHHTVEDVGICLGQAILQALGDKRGIARYGVSYVPMDEALARTVVDLSGRGYLVFNASVQRVRIGDFDAALAEEFLRAVAYDGRLTLHVDLLRGSNEHHCLEAVFKAFGRALDQACRLDERVQGVLSTKGRL